MAGTEYQSPEPSWRVYAIAFVLAAGTDFGLYSIWVLPLASALIAAAITGLVALFSVFLLRPLFETIIGSFIIVLPLIFLPMTFWTFWSFWIVMTVPPFVTGTCVGALCVDVWRERVEGR